VTDPSIAYILILLGIYALVFEFPTPAGVSGVVGAICVLIALYAFHLLPVNYAGLALMLVGIAFMVGAVFPRVRFARNRRAIAFVIGSVILIDTDVPGFGVPFSLVLGLAAGSAAFLFLVVGMALKGTGARRERARRAPRQTGEALEDFEQEGWARVTAKPGASAARRPSRRASGARRCNARLAARGRAEP